MSSYWGPPQPPPNYVEKFFALCIIIGIPMGVGLFLGWLIFG